MISTGHRNVTAHQRLRRGRAGGRGRPAPCRCRRRAGGRGRPAPRSRHRCSLATCKQKAAFKV
eukprot:10657976-Lingulodinium_polyedra.AAC.1